MRSRPCGTSREPRNTTPRARQRAPHRSGPGRFRRAAVLLVLASGLAAGCGEETAAPPTAEHSARAQRLGVPVELIYVIDLEGYRRATGAMGAYGDAGFQDIYLYGESDVRLTVERRTITAADCPSLPVPAASGAAVRCGRDGEGWRRSSGNRLEYALARGELLVRVSGQAGAVAFESLREAAVKARPATREELDEMLAAGSSGGAPQMPPRGDLPPHGDGAPDNRVGPGG